MDFRIAGRTIGQTSPVYFIADIAANHDGDLERAKMLVRLAKEAGADAAKFQNHRVEYYVSKKGFESLGGKQSHQSRWKKSVFDVYVEAIVPMDWTAELKDYCDQIGIHYFSTPYDIGMVDHLDPFVPAFKIGSGDINYIDMLQKVAGKGKPVLIGTGAANFGEVQRAVNTILAMNKDVVLMQCNTNYTASVENFDFINLNVLKSYALLFPDVVLGLSDHTHGHATVLGAVALGAKVIEKHFTDDTKRPGPDHPFSMDPKTWKEMGDRTRELQRALGSTEKKVETNESQTVVLQRRCIRAAIRIPKGTSITEEMLRFQRPAPNGSLEPWMKKMVVGRTASKDINQEDVIDFTNI
jgi:sialic acid synthase SpsE